MKTLHKVSILLFFLLQFVTIHIVAQIDSTLTNRVDTLKNFKQKNIQDIYISTDDSTERFKPISQLSDSETVQLLKDDSLLNAHPPKRAAIFSAILPGLGQAYNKKYFKVPIIYAALGGIGYLAKQRNDNYQQVFASYSARVDTLESTVDTYFPEYVSDSEIENYLQDVRRQRDYAYLWMGIVYVLNIVDASVDAHLMTFDVGDDLSMNIQPQVNNMWISGLPPSYGLKICFNF